MKSYQARLLKEYMELTDRLIKLSNIIEMAKDDSITCDFEALETPLELLIEQKQAMNKYQQILHERIIHMPIHIEGTTSDIILNHI